MNKLSKLFPWLTELWSLWMKNIEARRDLKRVRMAIKLANLKHKADKKRYYVLRDWNGKPLPLNRVEIMHLKKVGIMSNEVKIENLLKEALYYTSGTDKEL